MTETDPLLAEQDRIRAERWHASAEPAAPDTFTTLWEASMSNRGTFRFEADGSSIKLIGETHPRATILSVAHTQGLGLTITVHIEGGSYWAARGSRGYGAATLMTLLVRAKPFNEAPVLWSYVQIGARVEFSGNAESRALRTATARQTLTTAATK